MKKGLIILTILLILFINPVFAAKANKNKSLENLNTTVQENLTIDNNYYKISVTDLKDTQYLKFKYIIASDKGINISYTFDNSEFIGSGMSVKISLFDINNIEVKSYVDSFPINRDSPIERLVYLKLPGNLSGIYNLYMVLASEPENKAEASILFEKNIKKPGFSATGMSILENSDIKYYGYGIFILIILAIIVYIILHHDKNVESTIADEKNLKKNPEKIEKKPIEKKKE